MGSNSRTDRLSVSYKRRAFSVIGSHRQPQGWGRSWPAELDTTPRVLGASERSSWRWDSTSSTNRIRTPSLRRRISAMWQVVSEDRVVPWGTDLPLGLDDLTET